MAGAGTAQLSDLQVKERLAALTMPALILFGEHDRVVPPGNARLLAGKMPDARVVILPGVGHIFPVEDPDATVRAITDFLD
jgi:pimeloyl-ACP methyl ester carboxylesterase